MAKRGRQSAAAAETENIVDLNARRKPRLQASDGAPEDIRRLFAQVVTSAPADHFKMGDCHLIEAYAQAIWLSRKAFDEMQMLGHTIATDKDCRNAAKLHDMALKQMQSLARALRLTPQSNIDPKTAGRKRRDNSDAPPPWADQKAS